MKDNLFRNRELHENINKSQVSQYKKTFSMRSEKSQSDKTQNPNGPQ